MLASAVLVGIAVVAAAAAEGPGDSAGAPAPARQRELVHLLEQDCGSCHGGRLPGGLGPPLTAQALRDRPADGLVATIVHGRAGTPMPPWRRFMSEDETRWLVQRLQGSVGAPR